MKMSTNIPFCFSPGTHRSGQVRFLEGSVPTADDVRAALALLSGKTTKAQDILDHQVMRDQSTARTATYLCAQQGYPKLAQRYNRMAFGVRIPGSLQAFIISLDQYCLGMYGLLFEQFRERLATGGPIAKVKGQWDQQACFDELHLVHAALDFGSVYAQAPEVALGYVDLLARHPLGIGDLAVLATTVMPALRKRLTVARQTGALEEMGKLTDAIRALKARHLEAARESCNPAVQDPAWFDKLHDQCESLNS